MQLIGMLDSPYVRRTAISLRMLGIAFEHRAVSVFRHFDEFQRCNPVVKAPTLICDDGTVLMDSSLILQLAEHVAREGRSLLPKDEATLVLTLRVTGLALAACEKSISIVYERELRPADKQYDPWIERVTGQLLAACGALEHELGRRPLAAERQTMTIDGITAAVAWDFLQMMVPKIVCAEDYPRWRDFSAQAETLDDFLATPSH
jgi:glutathione S-transferase